MNVEGILTPAIICVEHLALPWELFPARGQLPWVVLFGAGSKPLQEDSPSCHKNVPICQVFSFSHWDIKTFSSGQLY